jgi:hypothetical protein
MRRPTVSEEARRTIPLFVDVRVRAAVRRQLGPGGDAGVDGAHEHLPRAGRTLLAVDERNLARGADRHHPLGHGCLDG